jgi:hypothetical protein
MVQLLATLAVLFSAADHWTTYLCLRSSIAGWSVSEANPLAAWLFDHFGLVGGLSIDSVVTVAALIFLVRTRRVGEPVKLVALGILVATTGWAVANNLQAVQELGLSIAG